MNGIWRYEKSAIEGVSYTFSDKFGRLLAKGNEKDNKAILKS